LTRTLIAVIGDADEKQSQHLIQLAEQVGEEIGKAGAVLICGGLGGVMKAAAKGAKRYGAVTVGILPFVTRAQANRFIDIVIPTGMGWGMKDSILVRSAHALIALGGGCGTLSEITLAYMHQKPLIVIKGTGGWSCRLPDPLDHRGMMHLEMVDTAQEAVAAALKKR
jgi:uncharacterized protein (TIGR00725 family)